jgi:very-short-patch-repair endonuclease
VKIHNIQRLIDRRKELRKNQTPMEEKLWWYLKDKRLGLKFRRQHSIGGYILDFYCKEKRLIIEIDGEIHLKNENKEYDAIRDKYFEELDYKTLRFRNGEVMNDVKKVVDKIKHYLKTNEAEHSLP